MTEFCPSCGNQRTGALRFCRSCGFDFEGAGTTPTTAPPSPSEPTPRPAADGGVGYAALGATPASSAPTSPPQATVPATWGFETQAPPGMVCGRCGKPLSPVWKGRCNHCGVRYAEAAPVPAGSSSAAAVASPAASTEPSGANLPLMAGVAWIIAAALMAFLAYQQWTFGSLDFDEDLRGLAVWNAITAAITLFFGARLIASPTRTLLDWSAAWAILSVASGVIQVAGTPGVSDVFVLSVIASAVAGVLSYVGRQRVPKSTTPKVAAQPVSGVPVAPSRAGRAEIAVVGLIVVALVIGGVLLTGIANGLFSGSGGATSTPNVGSGVLAGTFHLENGEPVAQSGGCVGTGGYEDIRPGTDVVLSNEAGVVIASSELSIGTPTGTTSCAFTFRMQDVPSASFYTIEVGDRGELTYSADEMERFNWDLSLELGS